MCHFITLVVPTDDKVALAAVMKRRGRGAWDVENPSLAAALEPGDRQYMTTLKHCDCGTVLGRRAEMDDDRTAAENKEVAHLRRKGWSEARIARALGDKAAAKSLKPDRNIDSFEQWSAVLGDIASELRLPRAGLFVHFYSGSVEDEYLKPLRRDVAWGEDHRAALERMTEDELTVFRFPA